MPVTVHKEPEAFTRAIGILENCCNCRKPTPFWFGEGTLNVALCESCAVTMEPHQVPTRAQWVASEKALRQAQTVQAPAQLQPSPPSPHPFAIGDVVRVKNPDGFLASFGKKIADRDAVVLALGPLRLGGSHDEIKVRFLKRNGRGQTFDEVMNVRNFVLKSSSIGLAGLSVAPFSTKQG